MLVEMLRCCNSLEEALPSGCSTSALQLALGSGLFSFIHAPGTYSYLRQTMNSCLTMSSEQQARNYAQYWLPVSIFLQLSLEQTQKRYQIVENCVSVPSLQFGSYMPYKVQAVLMDSLIIMNDNTIPYGT